MTLLLITCLAVAIVRIAEAVARRFITWFYTKKEHKKQYFYKRIVAIVSPELHERLKAHVMLLNTTVTDYVLTAVTEKLQRENHG